MLLSDHEIVKILEAERSRWSPRSGPPTYDFGMAFARAIERKILSKIESRIEIEPKEQSSLAFRYRDEQVQKAMQPFYDLFKKS